MIFVLIWFCYTWRKYFKKN